MNYRVVARMLGALILVIGVSMVFALLWATGLGETEARSAFLMSMTICLVVGLVLSFIGRQPIETRVLLKESLAVVALGWVMAAALGALPFIISKAIPSPIDAFFESMSGFTTTGASVLTDIEGTDSSILFWRSFTHWLGGIGIIVLFIAILPQMGVGARHLFRSEIPGVSKEGMSPRIKDTAIFLVGIYTTMTIVLTLLLVAQGMTAFDALCHTFGTVATGGFSTRNMSVAAYDSVGIDVTLSIFMIIAGTNFSLYLLLLRRKRRRRFFRDPEWRVYIGMIVIVVLLIAYDLLRTGTTLGVGEALRQSLFQTTSIHTTTGFATADFDLWPSFSQFLLVTLMFVGGSSGSTAGGMKVMRIIILVKYGYSMIYHWFRPHSVRSLKVGGMTIRDETLQGILGYFVLFMALLGGCTIIMTLLGVDLITSVTSVIATLGNIGPGLAGVGPTQHYAAIPDLGKLILSTCMLLGRLEIFTLMALFVPAFWKR
jgi:trk system potassium uptake protein TrkH